MSSAGSLQGVRGLMNLSHEKREDGLTTPTHAARARSVGLGSSDRHATSSDAGAVVDDDDDNVDIALESEGGGGSDGGGGGGGAGVSPRMGPASRALALENPNKHLRVADLLASADAATAAASSSSQDPFSTLLHTDYLAEVEAATAAAAYASDPALPAAAKFSVAAANGQGSGGDGGDAGVAAHAMSVAAVSSLTSEVSDVLESTQQWRREQEAKLQAKLREMNRAHRRELQARQAR
jgi:hypothetical protein